jgi:hypothetical protein
MLLYVVELLKRAKMLDLEIEPEHNRTSLA